MVVHQCGSTRIKSVPSANQASIMEGSRIETESCSIPVLRFQKQMSACMYGYEHGGQQFKYSKQSPSWCCRYVIDQWPRAAQLHEAHCRFLLIQSTMPLTMVRCPGPLAPPCTWTART